MGRTIRVKIVLLTVLILTLAISSNVLISGFLFQNEYSRAINAEMIAIGQNLKLQLDRLLQLEIPLEELAGFEQQCQDLVEQYHNLSYALVESPEGIILFHSNPALHGQRFDEIASASSGFAPDDNVAIPAFDMYQNMVATIRIGYPSTLISQKTGRLLLLSIGIAALLLILAVVVQLSGLFLWITKPLEYLAHSATKLAEGDISSDITLTPSRDEIGMLTKTFIQVIEYFREMADVATEISAGNLAQEVQPRSPEDALGHASLNMLTYLQRIAAVTNQIAEGNLGTTIEVRSTSDVFGQALNTMTSGLRSLIVQMRTTAARIAATGTSIQELATQDIEIVQQVTDGVERMIGTMHTMEQSVDHVAANMTTLSSAVEQTSSSVAEVTASIGQIAANSTELTHQTHATIDILNETVATLEQIVENIDVSRQLSVNTSQDALEGERAVEQVIVCMESIERTVMMAVDAITQFSQRSQDIDAILEVIHNITEQTSLLALNASIIAAQAGMHGRGFAVVADEIRSLSDGVEVSTKDIAKIVGSLKQDTANVVKTINQGAEHVKQGVQQTQHARETLQNILHSAQESSAVVTESAERLHTLMHTGRRVTEAMQQVNQMIDEITLATGEQKLSTEQINGAITEIHQMAAQTQLAATEQLRGVRQVLGFADKVGSAIVQNQESSRRITSTSQEFAAQARLLLEEVERFKLEA